MKSLSKKLSKYLTAVLLLIGVFSASIFNIVHAESGVYYSSNPNIRVGLVYGSGAVGSFRTSAPDGFIIGTVAQNASDAFTSFFYLKNTKISVSSNAKVSGKYSLEFTQSFSNFTEAYNFINNVSKSVSASVYPAYINNKITVRVGAFSSADSAKAYIAKVPGYSAGSLNVASDPATAAVVINPDTDGILFAFSNGENNLAVAAASSANPANSAYGQKITELSSKTTGIMTSPANNIYSGAFVYIAGSSGVEIVGMMSLEDYIKGVVPNEVYPWWGKEALKAFAVTARTLVINSASVKRHATSPFMMCTTTHCQYYTGLGKATEGTNIAVEETKDLIITYQNKPIEAYYCSSSGGATENHNDAWGGTLTLPYLSAVSIPQEKYWESDRPNAMWTNSASPKELYEYLTRSSSYSSRFSSVLKNDIASITVNSRSPGSNYIKSLTVTDKNGNAVTLTNSDNIRVAFGKYASSANMDIYRAFRFRYAVIDNGTQELEAGKTTIVTGNGVRKLSSGNGKLTILTSSGTTTINAHASGSNFIFDGRGWGHGVGMSQWGAQDMSEAGYGFEEIIKTFYTGVTVESITNITMP